MHRAERTDTAGRVEPNACHGPECRWPAGRKHGPLQLGRSSRPVPAEDELLIKVHTCGVCHTELDEIEGRMPPPRLPIVLGHQVVGRVAGLGPAASTFLLGDRAGVGWTTRVRNMRLSARRGEENLCDAFSATGRDANGGYAELMTVL